MSLPNKQPFIFPNFWQLKKILPIFDPDNHKISAADWIEKVENLGKERNWSEEHLLTNAVMRIEGRAHNWYDWNSGRILTWKDFKKALIKGFSRDIQMVNIWENIMSLKKEPAAESPKETGDEEDDDHSPRFCNVCSSPNHLAGLCPSLQYMFKEDSEANPFEYYRMLEEYDAANAANKSSDEDDVD